jgi:hypothetical protein
MAGRTIETPAWQTGDLLSESGDLGRTSVRHAQRSVDRREMSNRFSALSCRTRECVRTRDASFILPLTLISSRGMNHSDPLQYQCCSGFYIDIFNSLKDRLKFEFELYQVLDRTWGSRNPLTVRTSLRSIKSRCASTRSSQNKWNGLIAELLENRADLTLTSLKVTTERNSAIDFSLPLMETGIALIVSLRPGAISTTAFLSECVFEIVASHQIISRSV